MNTVLTGAVTRPLPLLADPQRWQWINRFERAARCELRHPRHRRWMARHQDQHAFREVMLVLKGRHLYGARGRVFRTAPGTVLLLDKREPHDARYSPYQPACRDLWLHIISPRQLFAHDLAYRNRRIVVTGRCMLAGPFVECLSQSWDICSAGDTSRLALVRLRAAVTMVLLHVLTLKQEPQTEPHLAAHQRDIVSQIQGYIQQHLSEDLSLLTLSRLAGYEAAHFHRLFRKHAGETIHRYVNQHRLQQAQVLLREGRTVQSVAESLGFATAAYFCRFFRRLTGHSPLGWKEHADREAGR